MYLLPIKKEDLIYVYNKRTYVSVSECAPFRENDIMQSYQISSEDSKTPEYMYLGFGFSSFLLVFILLI